MTSRLVLAEFGTALPSAVDRMSNVARVRHAQLRGRHARRSARATRRTAPPYTHDRSTRRDLAGKPANLLWFGPVCPVLDRGKAHTGSPGQTPSGTCRGG